MSSRMNLYQEAPDAKKGLLEIEKFIAGRKLNRPLHNLITIRASQINGCAHCLNMHYQEALAEGDDPQKLSLIPTWHEVDLFTPKEKAVLELTEQMTLISKGGVPDAVYQKAAQFCNQEELATIIMAIVSINNWNRVAITVKTPLK